MGALCSANSNSVENPEEDDPGSRPLPAMMSAEHLHIAQHNKRFREDLDHVVFAESMDLEEFMKQNEEKTDTQLYPHAVEIIRSAISKNVLLSVLQEKEISFMIRYAERMEVTSGEIVINQGDHGDFFYVVEQGSLQVLVNGGVVGEKYSTTSSFGELALLSGGVRAATIQSVTDGILWKLGRDTFRFAMKSATKAQEENALKCLRKVGLLAEISDDDLVLLSQAVFSVSVKAGDIIIRKNEPGAIFYMIQTGEVLVKEIGKNFSDVTIGPGDFFGEKALHTGDPRGATVQAKTDVNLLSLSRDDFEKILGPLGETLDRIHNLRVLASTELLSGLSEIERKNAASKFIQRSVPAGTVIVEQGQINTSFFVIKEGEVSLHTVDQEEEIDSLGAGQYFNLASLLEDGKASIGTFTTKTNCLIFELHQDDFRQAVTGDFTAIATKAYNARLAEVNAAKQMRVPFEQLKVIANLGQGTFGRVKLVQDKVSSQVFALKVLHKKELVNYKQQKNIMNEKNIMLKCHHPFILNLHNTYRDEFRLYLLLEFCRGGELFTVLHTEHRDGVDKPAARFYAACVTLALGYLLERSIIYRDLKPENMLVDAQGYVKIIDFGFAKEVKKKQFTLCGTPEYMAPEIVLGRGYDISVDWWALGILIYEMIAGYSPFAADDQNEILERITRNKPRFGSKFDDVSKNLVELMLRPNPKDRLASGPSGATAVKNHAFFDAIDFQIIIAKQMPPSEIFFIPNVTSDTDTQFFDHIDLQDKVDTSWVDPAPGWDNEF